MWIGFLFECRDAQTLTVTLPATADYPRRNYCNLPPSPGRHCQCLIVLFFLVLGRFLFLEQYQCHGVVGIFAIASVAASMAFAAPMASAAFDALRAVAAVGSSSPLDMFTILLLRR